MKKTYIFLLITIVALFSFTFQNGNTPALNNVMVQFVSTNGYGNNIYVDNLIVGTQFNNDLAVTSININKDTSYSTNGTSSFKVLPVTSVINVGTFSSASTTVTLVAGSYTSTKTVASIDPGNLLNVSFDSLTIAPNTTYNIKLYTNWGADQNKSNDTLSQTTLYLPGTARKVVFEAFTASTCAPCASQNPYLDAFIHEKGDTVVPIKTHVWWPAPGNDPMYLINSAQIQPRVSTYYAVNAVPTLVVDGIYVQVSGYSTLSNLVNPYNSRMSKGSPLSVSVVDTKIGDSIKSNVTVNILSPLSTGNYKLRVYSISAKISYPTAPGSNGETVFKDVFRFGYPDMNGISIPVTPGTYNYEYRYKLTPMSGATDTTYYTAAFVQNDVNKEIINAGKAPHYVAPADLFAKLSPKDSKALPLNNFTNENPVYISGIDNINGGLNYEIFEGGWPPSGWTIVNPNAGSLTWEPYVGVSGPLFAGNKAARLNCYSYSNTGQIDYLKSRVFNNVDPTDSIKFNWAHAIYSATYNDRLQVQISTNGGTTFPYTIFDKAGSVLATAPATTNDFVPSGPSQWGTFRGMIGDYIVGISQIGTDVPTHYALNQNYPNPFNPVTNISYMIPKSSKVSLKIYNINGQLVETLYEGQQGAGIYITQFNGSKLSSGVYFYKLEAGDFKEVRKLTLIK